MSYLISSNLEKQKIELMKKLSELTSKKPTHRILMKQSTLIRQIELIDRQILSAKRL